MSMFSVSDGSLTDWNRKISHFFLGFLPLVAMVACYGIHALLTFFLLAFQLWNRPGWHSVGFQRCGTCEPGHGLISFALRNAKGISFRCLWFFRVCIVNPRPFTKEVCYIYIHPIQQTALEKYPWIRNLFPSPKTNSSPPLKIGQQKPPPKKGKDSEIRHLFRRHLDFFRTKPDKMVRFLGGDIFLFVCTASPVFGLSCQVPRTGLRLPHLSFEVEAKVGVFCREFAAGWLVGWYDVGWQPDIWRRKPPFGCIKTL